MSKHIVKISDLSDPRLDPYRNLKDRELAAMGGLFLAEGEHLVRRLNDSDFPIESVLLAERRAEEMAPVIRDGVPVYVINNELMKDVIGYKFHSGVIACGRRKPDVMLNDMAAKLEMGPLHRQAASDMKRFTFVVCPEIANVENLGSIVRLCAGFGVGALILGERCADPFWRMSVRVSMGTVFYLPIVRSPDIRSDLARMRDEFSVELLATVLDKSAEDLKSAMRGPRIALLLGNEAQGLSQEHVDLCDRRVTIPMHHGTDSLNVAVAAGIFLYHFTR